MSDGSRVISVLLVEDNPVHADLIDRYLTNSGKDRVRLGRAQKLGEALTILAAGDVDALLLDLSLPDSKIDETLPRVIEFHGDVPIIVLTSLNDLEFGTRAVQQGAQDYLVKTDLSSELLVRAIRYAIERKKTKDRLEAYATDLERSNEHLRTFAHTVAHEVKSPLNVVAACLEFLRAKHGTAFDREAREMTQDASTSIQGLTELVNELLEFARIGSDDGDFKDFDAEAVFYQVYVLLRPSIREHGVSLKHDPLPKIHGIEVQFRQLLQNLVGNAIKYRSEQRPEIHVGVQESGSEWTFSVRDNGVGIPPELHERVFEAFVRVHRADEIPGTGIGLAFCKRIVDNHRGRIWIESQLGEGTIVYFTIPKESRVESRELRVES